MAKHRYRFVSSGTMFMPGMIQWLRMEMENDEAASIRAMIELMPTVPAKHVLQILDGDCEDELDDEGLTVFVEDRPMES